MGDRRSARIHGESALDVMAVLRSFPLSVSVTGRIIVHETAVGLAKEVFDRAYARAELEYMRDEARCECRGEHRTLDADEFRDIVLLGLAHDTRTVLGLTERDPVWPPVSDPPRPLFVLPNCGNVVDG